MNGARVLIMAGGTGGHVFPALAVAEELRARGVELCWLGTARGLESRLVPEAGIELALIDVAGLRGNGLLGWLAAPLRVGRALWQALGVVRRFRPTAVLGMGGFVTGPGGVAAWLARVPLLIHEQNAIAGLTNRLLAPLARGVFAAFPHAFGRRAGVVEVGNPVRLAIATLPSPQERLRDREGALRLLVVGGSLGALALNQTVPAALALLGEAQRPQVWHQTGERTLEAAKVAYAEAGVRAEVVPFIDDMAEAYAWADLVLCRAGALTVSELAAAGVAALLVPYPHAVDDHQTHNARWLCDAGAAELLPQASLAATSLAERLCEFNGASGRERLCAMAERGRALAHLEATKRVADACLQAPARGVIEGERDA